MKNLKITLTAALFMLAIGGAFASKKMAGAAFSSIADDPNQSEECQNRGTCSGTTGTCTAVFDGFTVTLYQTSGCATPQSGSFD